MRRLCAHGQVRKGHKRRNVVVRSWQAGSGWVLAMVVGVLSSVTESVGA